MKPAIFLDRDGVIVIENFKITSPDKIEVYPFVKDCVKKIHEAGFYAIAITNQSGVARGIFSESELIIAHEKLIDDTGIDRIYYCPHHPKGTIKKYTTTCNCRKPNIGLLKRAIADFDIDIDNSIMVGDRESDIIFAKNAGIKSVHVMTGYGKIENNALEKADYKYYDLVSFVDDLYFIKCTESVRE